MSWFRDTFGFDENDYKFHEIRAKFEYDKEKNILKSLENQKDFYVGKFITPTLKELHSMSFEEILALNEEKIEKNLASFQECVGKLENSLEKKNGETKIRETILPEEKEKQNNLKEEKTSEKKRLPIHLVKGDVRSFITNSKNFGAIFQVASQFNCLEMVGPGISPEDGITRYIYDRTQGPACALSCPAATLFRNYFWNGFGQTAKKQMNILDKIEGILLEDEDKCKNAENLNENEAEESGIAINNINTKKNEMKGKKLPNPYWKMENGYCLVYNKESLDRLNERLLKNGLKERLRENFKVGIQYETEVKLEKTKGHRITQIFCSALPISYCSFHAPKSWENFALFILECSYDAILTFANLLAETKKDKNDRVKVYLTSLGGGAFGNSTFLIKEAMKTALEAHKNDPLDVYLIEYQ